MGIDVCAIGRWKAGRVPRADAFTRIREAVDGLITDATDRRMLRFDEHEHSLYAFVHTLSEPIEFMWEPDGAINAGTKTSTVGPGYHAWVVDLIKRIGTAAGIEWDWSHDETEYSRDGDFAALQDAMARLLRLLATSFLQDDSTGGFICNMRLGFSCEPLGAFSLTPLGPRDRDWWESAKAGPALIERCRDFYIWWERAQDAAYWHKLGLALMWIEVPWHPPNDESEENTCRLALEALDRAITLDHTLSIPAEDMNELAEMLDLDPEQDEVPRPRPDGVGYQRHPTSRSAPGGWSVRVPGYFYEQWKQEEGVLTFWHGDRAVHVTTYSFDAPAGDHSKPPTAANLAADYEIEAPPDTERFEHTQDGLVGRAAVTAFHEDDFEGLGLQGCMAADAALAAVTVVFAEESDREWAIATWRSLTYVPQPADPAETGESAGA